MMASKLMRHPARQAGFTLIELMVVVMVLAILAGIAYASYSSSVVNSRRASASACLMEYAQLMERVYTTSLSYAGVNALPASSCSSELSPFYTFSLNGAATATNYSVQAVPVGNQLIKDAKCGTLRLNQAGTKSVTGAGGVNACW